MTQPIFISGNANKVKYLSRVLGVKLDHIKIDLDEIQSTDLRKIVEDKAHRAYDIIRKPVMVDDNGLFINALEGLPGPFIKYFIESAGVDKICRMLDGFDDRTAYSMAGIGVFDGSQFTYFEGKVDGMIAGHPRGDNGYGWDKIFISNMYSGRTNAELSNDEYDEYYKIVRSVTELRAFINIK